MTSYRPYLLRALWEWIADNGMTPHLLVDATQPGVRVPAHTVKEGKVVLNIADRAVGQLQIGNEAVSFNARFGGVSQAVLVPVASILAIYARETGQGMALPEDAPQSSSTATQTHVEPAASDSDGTTPPEPPKPNPPSGGKRPQLRVVK